MYIKLLMSVIGLIHKNQDYCQKKVQPKIYNNVYSKHDANNVYSKHVKLSDYFIINKPIVDQLSYDQLQYKTATQLVLENIDSINYVW
jgi:hypothetical protein